MSAAYVIDAVRAPFGRYGGGLSHVRPDDLGAHVVKALLDRTPDLDPAQIDEVLFGDANQAGEDNRNVARMAWLLTGLPTSVPGVDDQPPVRVDRSTPRCRPAARSRPARPTWCWSAGSSR